MAFVLSSQPTDPAESVETPIEDLPLPEGFTPLVGIKFCPPGGIYLLLFLWFLDNATDLFQVVTFVRHGDSGFAIFVAFFVTASILLVAFVLVLTESDAITNRGGPIACKVLLSPFQAAMGSVERGKASMTWGWIMRAEQQIEAPGTGLVAPYGMVLVSKLTLFQALAASYGLYSSSKAIAAGRMENWSGSNPVEFHAVRPELFAAIQLWLLLASFGELALFAVVGRVLHPSVPIGLYLIAAGINIHTEEAKKSEVCCQSVPATPYI